MIGQKASLVYGLCPGCDSWQVDIETTAGIDSIAAVESAILEHATTECVDLLRLNAPQYGTAMQMLGGGHRPRPAIVGDYS